MNYIKLFKLVFMCACLTLTSCTLFQKPSTIQVSFTNDCSLQQQEEAQQVIIERIKSVYKVKDFTILENGKFSVTYFPKENFEILPDLLEKKGEIIVYESYPAYEISELIFNHFGRPTETPTPESNLFAFFMLSGRERHSSESPVIGIALRSEKNYLDSLFRSEEIQKLLPADVSFMWKEESHFNEIQYELVAVKTSNFLPLNKETVKMATAESSQYSSWLELHIELYPEFTQKWADMTRNNILRHLPIVCDGNILSYPMVRMEITGGALSITGGYTNEEINTMLGFIKSDVLNCPAIFSVSE